MKKKIIQIPLSAFDIQIIKTNKNWTLEYSISKDRSAQFIINTPCSIDSIYKENNKLCVEVNTYSSEEFLNQ